MRKIETIQFQLRGLQPLIVTADAVSIDQRPVGIRRGCSLLAFLRGRRRQGACNQRNEGCDPGRDEE